MFQVWTNDSLDLRSHYASLVFQCFSINYSSIELVRKDSQPQKTCPESIDDDLPEPNDWVVRYEIRWRYLKILCTVRWSKILLKLYFYISKNSIIFEDYIRHTILMYAKANRRQDSDFVERKFLAVSNGCFWAGKQRTKCGFGEIGGTFFRVSRMI